MGAMLLKLYCLIGIFGVFLPEEPLFSSDDLAYSQVVDVACWNDVRFCGRETGLYGVFSKVEVADGRGCSGIRCTIVVDISASKRMHSQHETVCEVVAISANVVVFASVCSFAVFSN
jgi:hypothetical protein